MPNYYGLIFIFMSCVTYFSCVVFSIVNLVQYGSFSVVPLIVAQTWSHVFLVIGTFIAWDIVSGAKFNPIKIFKESFNASVSNFKFLLIFSGAMLLVSVLQGHGLIFESIQTLIYLNLYLLYGRN